MLMEGRAKSDESELVCSAGSQLAVIDRWIERSTPLLGAGIQSVVAVSPIAAPGSEIEQSIL